MLLPEDEKPDGTIRVYFADNTYKTVALKLDTPVSDVIEFLCKRVSASGRLAELDCHELFIIAPGTGALRERLLAREDAPLRIQRDAGGATAFKFVFREVRKSQAAEDEAERGKEEEGESVAVAVDAAAVAVADVSLRLRTGLLERLLESQDGSEEGCVWQDTQVILDEDRLWYKQAPTAESGLVGGGMTFLALSDCERVLECEEKRVLQLRTREATLTFRARTAAERNSWLLSIARQSALVKERNILWQAERIITGMEFRRSTQQLQCLNELSTFAGVLTSRPARELFIDFVRGEHVATAGGALGGSAWGGSAPRDAWPPGLPLEGLVECLERSSREAAARLAAAEADGPPAAAAPEGAEAAALAFAEGVLYARFQESPSAQNRLCRLAAGGL